MKYLLCVLAKNVTILYFYFSSNILYIVCCTCCGVYYQFNNSNNNNCSASAILVPQHLNTIAVSYYNGVEVLRHEYSSLSWSCGSEVLRTIRKQGYHSRKRLDSMFRLGKCLQNLCVMLAIFTHTSRTHARVHALSNTSEIEDNMSRLNLMRSPKSCRPTYKGQWKCHPRKVLQLGFLLSRLKNMGLLYTCLLYTSPSPRDATLSRMPSSA